MKPARSVNSIPQKQNQISHKQSVNSRDSNGVPKSNGTVKRPTNNDSNNNTQASGSSTSPICRCRVMYLGSSVPHVSKDGLQGIQEPLRELYPDRASLESGNAGIDSWLSVWSNGILIENVDEAGREVKRFFKIDALHYCAAVRYVQLTTDVQSGIYSIPSLDQQATLPKFLPLDSPYARQANSNPPIFASILRRTSGIKVLECHAFICKREAAANALVRCCFHAYADTMYAKQIGADVNGIVNSDINNNHRLSDVSNASKSSGISHEEFPMGLAPNRKSKSIAALNENEQRRQSEQQWQSNDRQDIDQVDRGRGFHQGWTNSSQTMATPAKNEILKKQSKFSKSLHHLNCDTSNNDQNEQPQLPYGFPYNQSTSASCMNMPAGIANVPPFYDPQAGRVPSYPPPNLLDSANNGGTLRSIKSMAATSIASTLLRSKKHAKAMSIAHLNKEKGFQGFHQQPTLGAATMGGPLMMPPIPAMFLPSRPILSGSQTMKLPNRPYLPFLGPPINFEAMTPKEIKKILKKQGIDPAKICENGLPIGTLRTTMTPGHPYQLGQPGDGGTMLSQSIYSDIYRDMPDGASIHGMAPIIRPAPVPSQIMMDSQVSPLKPILVKPNPEFIKSKEGKKWLKQQKEFKKLLPPHLDGLPIVFGPPPMDALEPANGLPAPFLAAPPMPVMDSSAYYCNPFLNQTSAANTMLGYSPSSNMNLLDSSILNGANEVPILGYPPRAAPGFLYGNASSMGHSPMMTGPAGRQHLAPMEAAIRASKRNHMVEQSVISLGDENDYEDDDNQQDANVNLDQDSSYYSPASGLHQQRSDDGPHYVQPVTLHHSKQPKDRSDNHHQSHSQSHQPPHIPSSHPPNRFNSYTDQGYERPMMTQQPITADDQGSYYSGIYKREHINERAFSYSIRQEHRSSGPGRDSDSDPSTTRADLKPRSKHRQQLDQTNGYQQEARMNNHHASSSGNGYDRNGSQANGDCYTSDDSQTIPVNELANRLKNQLNMKSFNNQNTNRIKSYM